MTTVSSPRFFLNVLTHGGVEFVFREHRSIITRLSVFGPRLGRTTRLSGVYLGKGRKYGISPFLGNSETDWAPGNTVCSMIVRIKCAVDRGIARSHATLKESAALKCREREGSAGHVNAMGGAGSDQCSQVSSPSVFSPGRDGRPGPIGVLVYVSFSNFMSIR